MKRLLTPKQVALAIGASESSLKRWCDSGLIATIRTGGGHRRLPIESVIDFLRTSRHPLVRPEILGLPTAVGQGERVMERAREQFRDALVSGDEEQCRRIAFDLFLARQPLSLICDRVFATAFHDLGEAWEHGAVEVYQERRACEITLRVLEELRQGLPPAPDGAPTAIGGTPEGDFYSVPARMVELVLLESGWRTQLLGSSLPLATLETAVAEIRPRLMWLSVSHLVDRAMFLAQYAGLYRRAREAGTLVVVGGRALDESLRTEMQFSTHCDTMQHLAAFLTSLRSEARSA
jgi:methanogenic corrinoid protein MtbC1